MKGTYFFGQHSLVEKSLTATGTYLYLLFDIIHTNTYCIVLLNGELSAWLFKLFLEVSRFNMLVTR